MAVFEHAGKRYKVDSHGFLLDPRDWDENFAIGMAPGVRIPDGLTEDHWRVIRFLRNEFDRMNSCPLVYVACKKNELGLGDLERLFPTGYLRGACKLAGITYREGLFQHYWLEENLKQHEYAYNKKTYNVDHQGFLVDMDDWDERFALLKAYELKMPEYLTEAHWRVIYYLRKRCHEGLCVPTIYETCADNGLSIERFQQLFPDGYHRGAVKIAGLHVR
ncbi:TusE/DsrC/DsvC family sulfur relay protein [candidate division GN15 bacterium]|nr:TusE/DsrC/DsvC family sulfur relay protein [candidate division GN15 bacterium]